MAVGYRKFPGQRSIAEEVLDEVRSERRPRPAEEIRRELAKRRSGTRIGSVRGVLDRLLAEGLVEKVRLSVRTVGWKPVDEAEEDDDD